MRGVGVGCSQSGGFVQTCLTASHPGCNARSFMLMTLGRVASVGDGWVGVGGRDSATRATREAKAAQPEGESRLEVTGVVYWMKRTQEEQEEQEDATTTVETVTSSFTTLYNDYHQLLLNLRQVQVTL